MLLFGIEWHCFDYLSSFFFVNVILVLFQYIYSLYFLLVMYYQHRQPHRLHNFDLKPPTIYEEMRQSQIQNEMEQNSAIGFSPSVHLPSAFLSRWIALTKLWNRYEHQILHFNHRHGVCVCLLVFLVLVSFCLKLNI